MPSRIQRKLLERRETKLGCGSRYVGYPQLPVEQWAGDLKIRISATNPRVNRKSTKRARTNGTVAMGYGEKRIAETKCKRRRKQNQTRKENEKKRSRRMATECRLLLLVADGSRSKKARFTPHRRGNAGSCPSAIAGSRRLLESCGCPKASCLCHLRRSSPTPHRRWAVSCLPLKKKERETAEHLERTAMLFLRMGRQILLQKKLTTCKLFQWAVGRVEDCAGPGQSESPGPSRVTSTSAGPGAGPGWTGVEPDILSS